MNDEDSTPSTSRNRLPGGPRDLRDLRDLIVPYVDGECDALEASWLEAEMRRDPRLAREVDIQAELRESLALVYRRRQSTGEHGAADRALADRVRRAARRGRRRRSIVAITAAAAALIVVSVLAFALRDPAPSGPSGELDVAGPPDRPPASRSDAEFLEMLRSLDVLEALLDEEVEVTPELTELIRVEGDAEGEGRDGAAGDEPVAEEDVLATDAETIFEYLLEEEFLWEH